VASSWRNEQQPFAVGLLRMDGHEVYDFRHPPHGDSGFSWRQIDPDWQGWTPEKYRQLLTTHPVASHGFVADFRAMQWADTCLLLLPCGRSAHLEAGWFCGAGKRCIVLLAEGEPELMNLLATDICISLDEVRDLLGRAP
jgi:hypothetical protein